MLDAERLIRLKGLIKKRKSRKVRLLHHYYAYTRIFYESTFVLATDAGQRNQVRDVVEKSGLVIVGQDALSFRLGQWGMSLDQKMLERKTCEQGENDLHLQMPGIWDRSLYPDIYEIPESFLMLLSQVIRLGNEKDLSERNVEHESLSWQEFSSRAKTLERCICQWKRPEHANSDGSLGKEALDADRLVVDHMLDALHHALMIYFYRRIYDVDASILQQKVEKTIDSLLRCAKEDKRLVRSTAAFIWLAFIAGCEALSPDLQALFSAWFENNAGHSGLQSFSTVLLVIQRVWNRRRDLNDGNTSWPDL
jgi:arginine metabolism regulation protein II